MFRRRVAVVAARVLRHAKLTPPRGALWCIDAALIIGVGRRHACGCCERKRREFGLAADAKIPDP